VEEVRDRLMAGLEELPEVIEGGGGSQGPAGQQFIVIGALRHITKARRDISDFIGRRGK